MSTVNLFELSKTILSEKGPLHRTQFLVELKRRSGLDIGENALLGPSYRDAKSGKEDRTFDFTNRIYSLRGAVNSDNLNTYKAQRLNSDDYKKAVAALQPAVNTVNTELDTLTAEEYQPK